MTRLVLTCPIRPAGPTVSWCDSSDIDFDFEQRENTCKENLPNETSGTTKDI